MSAGSGPRSRWSSLLGGALATATGCVVLVVLIEGALRLFGVHYPSIPQPERTDRGVPWTYDATLGWYHIPRSDWEDNLGGPDRARVHINSLGFRGPEITRQKPAGALRIVLVGDSYAFGVGVDEPHLFPAELQQRLAEATGRAVEVANLGVSGYATDQELLLLRDRGIPLAPDLVILAMCDNDFLANTQDFIYHRYYKPYAEPGPAGQLEFHNQPVPHLDGSQRLKVWLCEHSNLWNMVRSRGAARPAVRRVLDWFEPGLARETKLDPVALTGQLVAAMRELSEGAGAEFVTFNVAQDGEDTRLFQQLRNHLRRDGVRFFGLEGPLGQARSKHPEAHWDFGHDHHWNVDAHHLVAREVAAYLQRAGFRLFAGRDAEKR